MDELYTRRQKGSAVRRYEKMRRKEALDDKVGYRCLRVMLRSLGVR
jgi:hypothetical protein